MMRKRLAFPIRISGVLAIIPVFFVLSARAKIVGSVSMPANSHEQVSGGRFEEIPAPAGARPGSQWFACEPSESWGTWIGDGPAKFFLDSLEEDGQRIKACRTRINRDTKEYTRGCFTKLLVDTPMGYVYRVHVRYKCPGATQPKPIDLRPIFRTSGGITYAGRALPASEDWSSYTSPWVAPPGAGATLDVEVLYKHLNDGRQHLDCWFRTFLVERVPVKLRRPADGEIVRGRSPVLSWDVARADVLQVSTSEDFPPGDATWRVGKNEMPVAADQTGGMVLHPLAYNFCGATSGYRGTVSIPMELQMQVVKAVIRNLWEQEFRVIFVLSIHAPNITPITMAIRDLFEYERIVAHYFNPLKFAEEKYPDKDEAATEAAMCYAAMEVLGMEDLIPSRADMVETGDPPPVNLPGYQSWTQALHYQRLLQHQPGRKVDVEIGREWMREAAEKLAGRADELRTYAKFIEEGGNAPYRVEPCGTGDT